VPRVSWHDWLLFFHVLSAFILVAALVALWGLVWATRPASSLLDEREARRFGRLGGPLVGVGMIGTLAFGIWLAIEDDAYKIWDGWIIAALILWALAGYTGGRAGRAFEADPAGGRSIGIRFQAVTSLLALAILVLMIFKPGA
jgi:uncharacterized membrane protein